MTLLQQLVDAVALGSLFALVAMGIGLVFGVMRLINFAYGELIAAGGYALLLTDGFPVAARIVICFAIVIAFSLAMELGYRPLRGATAATMLVATFALSFTLQNVAVLAFGGSGENARFLPALNRAVEIGDIRVRWVTFATIGVGLLLLAAMALLLGRTNVGLQMRAAAVDFRTARLLGVRANSVIVLAFLLAGVLAAVVAVLLAVQRPLITPSFGFNVVIPALVGVVVGGMDRLVTATLGGFTIGFATSLVAARLPSEGRVFLTTAIFVAVIVVLLAKPSGLFDRRRAVERV